jgi:hypothetical protein
VDHGLTFLGRHRSGNGWGCDRPAEQRADRQRTAARRGDR